MRELETLAVYAFATVLQLPFHLIIGLPWFLVAWVAWRLSRSLSRRARAALIAISIAGGLAPLYGFHASMMPAYAILIGDASFWLMALVSFAITWLVIFVSVFWLTKPRTNDRPVQSNL